MAGTFIELSATNSGITSLTGDVLASGNGSVAATVVQVGGVAAATIATDCGLAATAVQPTRLINTTGPITGGGDLSADRTIAIPKATSSVDGYLAQADFSTFNNKEPAISSGTTAQFWRGDKSFQNLVMAALTAVVSGTAAATGKIGELLTASQASAVTTNVAASGNWGQVKSISLSAGAWLVWGVVGFTENGATMTDFLAAGISAASDGTGMDEFNTSQFNGLISSTSDLLLTIPPQIININATTTYYLNSKFNYSAGTPKHRGKISALRIF